MPAGKRRNAGLSLIQGCDYPMLLQAYMGFKPLSTVAEARAIDELKSHIEPDASGDKIEPLAEILVSGPTGAIKDILEAYEDNNADEEAEIDLEGPHGVVNKKMKTIPITDLCRDLKVESSEREIKAVVAAVRDRVQTTKNLFLSSTVDSCFRMMKRVWKHIDNQDDDDAADKKALLEELLFVLFSARTVKCSAKMVNIEDLKTFFSQFADSCNSPLAYMEQSTTLSGLVNAVLFMSPASLLNHVHSEENKDKSMYKDVMPSLALHFEKDDNISTKKTFCYIRAFCHPGNLCPFDIHTVQLDDHKELFSLLGFQRTTGEFGAREVDLRLKEVISGSPTLIMFVQAEIEVGGWDPQYIPVPNMVFAKSIEKYSRGFCELVHKVAEYTGVPRWLVAYTPGRNLYIDHSEDVVEDAGLILQAKLQSFPDHHYIHDYVKCMRCLESRDFKAAVLSYRSIKSTMATKSWVSSAGTDAKLEGILKKHIEATVTNLLEDQFSAFDKDTGVKKLKQCKAVMEDCYVPVMAPKEWAKVEDKMKKAKSNSKGQTTEGSSSASSAVSGA